MITKSFHDIYDLVEIVGTLKDANIDITFENGMMRFTIANYSDHDANGLPRKNEYVTISGNDITIDGYLENIDKAHRIVEDKISSGEWKKNDDCA
mgnify:CR=1 FL=1